MQFRRIPAVMGTVALILCLVTAAPSGAVDSQPAQSLGATAAEPSAKKSSAGKGTISGRVTFQGKPAKNVRVVVFREDTSTDYRTRTDSRGRYTLKVPATSWFVVAEPSGLNAYKTYFGNVLRGQDMKVAKVRKGRTVTADIKLAKAAGVKGRVVDAQGAPVKGATLEVRAVDRVGDYMRHWRPVKTDEKGRFRLLGLPAGRLDVVASLPGDRRREGPSGSVRVRGTKGKVVTTSDIVVRAVAEGVVTADVAWGCSPHCPSLAMPVYAVDDAEQRYTLEQDATTGRWSASVPTGTWRVVVNGANLASGPVTVAEGTSTHVGTLEVPQLTGTVEGTALKKDGTPVPAGTVVLLRDSFGGIGRHVRTTRGGAFRAQHVAAGSHTLHVLLPASSWGAEPDPRTVSVRDGATTTATLRFKASRTVRGTVTHKGKGVEDIYVVLDREYPLADIHALTDAKGRFTLRNVPSGTFTLVASELSGPQFKIVRTTLTVTKSRKGLTLALKK